MEANYFTILYWFCHTSTWIHHGCTRVPILNPLPTSLPIPSLWIIPVHQPQAFCIMHQNWTGDSFHIWYYTCFNAILSNHPTLTLSHRVQKIVLYICVSFAVSHTGLNNLTLHLKQLEKEEMKKPRVSSKKEILIIYFLKNSCVLVDLHSSNPCCSRVNCI